MKHGKTMTILFSLFLALAMIPLAAFATGEDILESAPAVPLPDEEQEAETAADEAAYIPYLPYEGQYFFVSYGTEDASDLEQYYLPRLTEEEAERARRFLAETEAGKNPEWNGPDCLDQAEDVTVGVYTLDPKDYHGETFYVILPTYRMTDDMLLSLIHAFSRLGIRFDPDLLNYRNCCRGYNRTRFLSYEEIIRMQTIRRQVHRGMITRDSVPAGTACRVIKKEKNFGPSFDRVSLYPYRSMTDEELAVCAIEEEGAWEIDPVTVEKQALECIFDRLDAPLALVTEEGEMYEHSDGSRYYSIGFRIPYTDGITGRPDQPIGKPYEIRVGLAQTRGSGQLKPDTIALYFEQDYSANSTQGPDLSGDEWKWPDLSDEEWQAEACKWAGESFLKLSGEEMPQWQLTPPNPEDTDVTLTAFAKGMRIDLSLDRRDHTCESCLITVIR